MNKKLTHPDEVVMRACACAHAITDEVRGTKAQMIRNSLYACKESLNLDYELEEGAFAGIVRNLTNLFNPEEGFKHNHSKQQKRIFEEYIETIEYGEEGTFSITTNAYYCGNEKSKPLVELNLSSVREMVASPDGGMFHLISECGEEITINLLPDIVYHPPKNLEDKLCTGTTKVFWKEVIND